MLDPDPDEMNADPQPWFRRSLPYYSTIEILFHRHQCTGSGSVSFWASRILIRNYCMDPEPDPSISMQENWEKRWFELFCDFLMTSYLWDWCNNVHGVPKYPNKQKNLLRYGKKTKKKSNFLLASWNQLTKRGSVRIQGRIRNLVYGSKDPDPSQKVTDPEHW
jgi:hypothetical protein